MPQEGSEGLGLRPSLVVGDALPFSSLPTDNGSGSVSSLYSDAAGTGLDELGLGCQRHHHCGLGLGQTLIEYLMLPCVQPFALCMVGCVHLVCCGPIIATSCCTA